MPYGHRGRSLTAEMRSRGQYASHAHNLDAILARLTAYRSSGTSGRLGKVTPDNRSFVVSDTAPRLRPPDLHNHMITRTLKQP
ncbi:hypothetical protein FHS42_007360 [Streptomyces zagrosensis]|uniref:Uncharacterized protein n=1 Tax=Streptomyces zagrosensis TaxID=1042984 RepID=A0A7W9V2S1_9ACTN|nr:hypothetical protein [Streptomyces zagrosensis]